MSAARARHARRSGARTRSNGRERGSIAIEMVASVPLLVACTILLIEGLLGAAAMNIATKAARDGARVEAMGGDGSSAAREQVPGWLEVQSVTPSAPGCTGACSTVRVGIPLGLPGFVTITHLPITRSAYFPR